LTSGAVTPAVAASITGQGSLATANDVVWATQVTGVGKPADNATASVVYIQQTTPSSANVDDIWILTNGSGVTQAVYAYNGSSWVLGADITGLNVAASITGQGALATQNTVNPGQITSGAVSSTPTAFTSGTTSLYAGSPGAGSTSTIQSFTTTTGAGIVTLSWSLSAAYYSGTSAPTLIMELYRDGTLINGATAPNGTNPFQSQTCQDLPGAGSHTYTLKAFAAGYGGRVDVSNIELIGSVILA